MGRWEILGQRSLRGWGRTSGLCVLCLRDLETGFHDDKGGMGLSEIW